MKTQKLSGTFLFIFFFGAMNQYFMKEVFFYLIRWGLNSCFIDKQMNSIFFGKLIKGDIWKNSCDSIFDFIPCCPS